MRIDDENKVVWCSEGLFNWKESFPKNTDGKDEMLYKFARVGFGYWLHDYNDNALEIYEWFCFVQDESKLDLIKAIVDDYEFKIEQKEYYWRKKKEHFASFETRFADYLNVRHHGKNATLLLGDSLPTSVCKTKFTEQEARELLKDDFNMFEKVECE